jgi:hypothetical protein
MKLTAIVNNLPRSINKYGYIVARAVEGELWFYGAWHEAQEAEAYQQAREVDGLVLKVED